MRRLRALWLVARVESCEWLFLVAWRLFPKRSALLLPFAHAVHDYFTAAAEMAQAAPDDAVAGLYGGEDAR